MTLVMLLALILPMQSFARDACRQAGATPVAGHQHCGKSPAGSQSADVGQHHHCGSCCVAAAVSAPLRFTSPSFANAGISLPVPQPLLKVALDRLDRPPRLVIR